MEKMLVIQFHTMGKMLVIKLFSLEKMLMMLFSYSFVDKKIDEKNSLLLSFIVRKKCLFWCFHTHLLCTMKLYERVWQAFFHQFKLYDKHFLSTRDRGEFFFF